MRLHRITGFLDERGEFERTFSGLECGWWELAHNQLQSKPLTEERKCCSINQESNFRVFRVFRCLNKITFNSQFSILNLKKLWDYSFLSYILFIFAYQNWVLTMKYKIFILVILVCLVQLPMSAQQMIFQLN